MARARSSSLGSLALARDESFDVPGLDKQSQRKSIGYKAGFPQAFCDPREIELADGYKVIVLRGGSRMGDTQERRRFWFPSSVPSDLSVSIHDPQVMEEQPDMDTTANRHECQDITAECRVRLANALRKRLYPNTALNRKQLAYGIGACGRTLDRWLDGSGTPSWEMVCQLIQFFRNHGDVAFAAEVTGFDPSMIVPLSRIREARKALERIEEAAR